MSQKSSEVQEIAIRQEVIQIYDVIEPFLNYVAYAIKVF